MSSQERLNAGRWIGGRPRPHKVRTLRKGTREGERDGEKKKKNSTESAIPRPPAAEVEVRHMPLKTLLSPAAPCDEASTFLLPLINATSQLVGYNTWPERAGDPGRLRRRGCAPLETAMGTAGCRGGD